MTVYRRRQSRTKKFVIKIEPQLARRLDAVGELIDQRASDSESAAEVRAACIRKPASLNETNLPRTVSHQRA